MVELEEVSIVEIESAVPTSICVKIGAGCMTCFFADQCLQTRPLETTSDTILVAVLEDNISESSDTQSFDIAESGLDKDIPPQTEPVEASVQVTRLSEIESIHDYTSELEDDSISIVIARRPQPIAKKPQVVPSVLINEQPKMTPNHEDRPISAPLDSHEVTADHIDLLHDRLETLAQEEVIDTRVDNAPQTILELAEQRFTVRELTQVISTNIEPSQPAVAAKENAPKPAPIVRGSMKLAVQDSPKIPALAIPAVESGYTSDVAMQDFDIVDVVEQNELDSQDPDFAMELPLDIDDEVLYSEDITLIKNSNDEFDILRRYPATEEVIYKSSILEIKPILSGIDSITDPEDDHISMTTYNISYTSLLQRIASLALTASHAA